MSDLLVALLPLAFAVIYCLVQTVRDVKQRRYWWAAAGVASTIGIAITPIPTHAVKVLLPAQAN